MVLPGRLTRFTPTFKPLTNVTPFTYRDTYTVQTQIAAIKKYLSEQLTTDFDDKIGQVFDQTEQAVTELAGNVQATVEEWASLYETFMSDVTASLMALNDHAVTNLMSDETSLLGQAMREMFPDKQGFQDLSEQNVLERDALRQENQSFKNDMQGEMTSLRDDVDTTVADFTKEFRETTNRLEMDPALVRLKAQLAFGEGDRNSLSWLVFLGSSTTGGANISNVRDRWVFRIKEYLKNIYPKTPVAYVTLSEASTYRNFVSQGVHVVNGGVGGTTSRNYVDQAQLNRIENIAGRRSFIHMIGSNDQSLKIPVEEYTQNVENAIQDLDRVTGSRNVHILVHAYERLDVPDKTGLTDWSEYGDALQTIANRDPDARMFIDLSPHYKSLGFPYSDDLGIMQERVHQNERGHHLMADLMRDYLRFPDVSVAPQYVPLVVGADRFVSSGSLVGSRATDQGTWARRGASWDCVAGAANPRGESIGMMSTTEGAHGAEALLRLYNVPSGGQAGLVVALRSSTGSHIRVYFQNERLVIARVNSEGAVSTQASVGHLMNGEVFLKAEYNRGTINVWVNQVLKISHRVTPLQEFFHADASWCGMFANRAMSNVFREVRMWSLQGV